MSKNMIGWAAAAAAAAAFVGCATAPSDSEVSAKATQVLKASFKARGQAKLDRLDQDETQKLCTQYSGKVPPKDVVDRIEKVNFTAIKWPADGKYLGDWKNGEKVAQLGRGMQYSDNPKDPAGGNCYACHQLAPQATAFKSSLRCFERRKAASYSLTGPTTLAWKMARFW
jgi:sulfur-oxidizing protein SoxX